MPLKANERNVNCITIGTNIFIDTEPTIDLPTLINQLKVHQAPCLYVTYTIKENSTIGTALVQRNPEDRGSTCRKT